MSGKRIVRYEYQPDLEKQFLDAATSDLKYGKIAYVYKENILNKLKETFNDLEITRNEFYWSVINKEKTKKRGRPKNMEM